ncbi:MAG: ABC transporter ATP-binding protein, partial [Planctomycetes bacterium]|nr:ABC transporter ATP-binding protein [Planctomycetota bacterium]
DNINLDIHSGSITYIIGPSGSGKTSLLNIIGLLDAPSTGQMFLNGNLISNPVNCFKLRAKEIGFVFQLFYLLEYLTVMENIEIPMFALNKNKRERQKRSEALLENIGLESKKTYRASELSGGEKQRVAIARALANNPKLILADEPTGNLDSNTGKNIINLLKSINEQNHTTIIIVTHNMEITVSGSTIVKLKDGKID